MIRYKVAKVYQYTEVVEVLAESSRDAKDLAESMSGDMQNDDCLYDCIILSESFEDDE